MNPLWNSLLVGGWRNGKSFLGYVDLLGTTYTASTLATGYGAYIAQPLLRKAVEGRETELTEEEGIKIIEQSMKVLFYRDARSLNKVRFWTFYSHDIPVQPQAELGTNDFISIKWPWSRRRVWRYPSLGMLRPNGRSLRRSEVTEHRRNEQRRTCCSFV